MTTYKKYPRTPHLPWSPGASADDVWTEPEEHFAGEQIVITEKMDGENTTLYADHLHARSIDSKHHPSRSWVKGLHQQIAHQIPAGWRICGENLFAKHSIGYETLPSYFMVFSIWDEHNRCLSWDETIEWCALLGLELVPTLFEGLWNKQLVHDFDAALNLEHQEGYVVRTRQGFSYEDFGAHIAKWVRSNHVQTDQHWMYQEVIPNGLESGLAPKE